MRIIPAIDLIDGKCVRLTQGDFSKQKTYDASPLDIALRYQDEGYEYLHLVDLEGAKKGQIVHWKTLETLAQKTTLKIDFGGGIKTQGDVRVLLECGAKHPI
jgi:phosphoribosylformimino-5-aminoimidazole carboxamide ribotide isomerase